MELTEFKIKSRNETFRVANIKPVELLAISTQINLENLTMTNNLYNFCFENLEVKMGEAWVPVKTKGKEVWWPKDIVNDFESLNDLFAWMMDNVIMKVFQKSSESTSKTE